MDLLSRKNFLSRQDCAALSAWMVEETTGNYFMVGKGWGKPPHPDLPVRHYRKPVFLCHEERALLVMVIKCMFWRYLRIGKLEGFNSDACLQDIARRVGLPRYANNHDLKWLCRQFADKIPNFIKTVEKGAS